MRFNHVMHALEAAGGSFFFDEERRVVFAGGIIYGVNQAPCLPSDPFVGVSILMDYYAWQGGSFTTLSVSRFVPVADQSTCPVRLLGSSPCGDGNCAHIRRVCEQLPLALAVSRSILLKLL